MFDPSIILGAKQYTGPDPNETMRTLGQLALMHTQQQQGEASLADLLNQRQQAQAVRGVYAANPDDPAARVRGLYAAGAGDQARQEQDQDAQHQKMLTDLVQHVRQRVTNTLFGTKDQADYEARLARMDPRERAMFAPPATWEEAKPLVEALAIPPEKRAELDATKEWHDKLLGAKTFKDGTGQGLQYNPETDTFDKKLGKPKPQKAAGAAGGADDGGLNDAAIDSASDRYNQTGELPPLGAGKAGLALRTKILNAAALKKGGSIAGNKASYKADAASLTKLQQQADSTDQFENTALKNLDTALGAAANVAKTNSSLLNAPLRKWAEMTGDADVSAYNSALLTAQTEISKVLSGANSSVVSDSARHEAQDLLKPDASLAQLQSAAAILKKDMANRKTAIAEGMQQIRDRIGKGGKAAAKSAPQASAEDGLTPEEQAELDQLRKEHGK